MLLPIVAAAVLAAGASGAPPSAVYRVVFYGPCVDADETTNVLSSIVRMRTGLRFRGPVRGFVARLTLGELEIVRAYPSVVAVGARRARYLVLVPAASDAELDSLERAIGFRTLHRYRRPAGTFAAWLTAEQVRALTRIPAVLSIQPDPTSVRYVKRSAGYSLIVVYAEELRARGVEAAAGKTQELARALRFRPTFRYSDGFAAPLSAEQLAAVDADPDVQLIQSGSGCGSVAHGP